MYITLLTLVRILAGVMILGGIVFAVWPDTMRKLCAFLGEGRRLYVVAGIRITMGIILLLAAQGHAKRIILATFGVIILLAGVSQLVISLERQKAIVNWMTGRSEVVRRLMGIAVVLVGGLMLIATFLN